MFVFPLVVCDSLVCKQSQVPLSIVRTYGANKNEETFELWKDSPSSGTLITLYNGKQAEESEITIDICVEKGTYALILSDRFWFDILLTIAPVMDGIKLLVWL